MATTPTGLFHEVPIEDLFFSTTDAKGVIDEANEVFARNARFERGELLGAPHNLIRHPDMPAAVFRATWDLLQTGSPVCAYVKNLAKDGSTYWAFATIVPIQGRYLSVRATPCDHAARDLFDSLYSTVRTAELAAREAGSGAREVAEVGARVLGQALADNGFASYAALQLDLVPVEVAAREKACPPMPAGTKGTPSAKILEKVADARGRLGAFAEDIQRSLVVADSLARDVRRLGSALAPLDTAVSGALAALSGANASEVGALVPVVRSRLQDGIRAVTEVGAELAGVVEVRKHLGMSSAIARMQAEALGRYVLAVEAGREDPRVSERALSSLSTALLAILDADLSSDQAATAAYAERVERLAGQVEGVRETTDAWRRLLAPQGMGGGPGGGADGSEDEAGHEARVALDVALTAAADQMARVRAAVGAFGSTGAALERDALAKSLARIVELAAKI